MPALEVPATRTLPPLMAMMLLCVCVMVMEPPLTATTLPVLVKNFVRMLKLPASVTMLPVLLNRPSAGASSSHTTRTREVVPAASKVPAFEIMPRKSISIEPPESAVYEPLLMSEAMSNPMN
jgi:hypothetical protein